MAKPKTINWTEKQLDARLNITAKAHEAAGYEGAAAMLLNEAAEAFKQDRDEASAIKELARKLSDVAMQLRKQQKSMRDTYDQEFPTE